MRLEDRGKIRNREYAQILHDMSGLRWGKITPTDIDAFLDFGNKAFVFIESKFKGKALTGGQKIALERLVDACSVPTILIVVEHECKAGEDIDMGSLFVTQYRLHKRWRIPAAPITARHFIEAFLRYVGINVQ
jgi:hypothetical protein